MANNVKKVLEYSSDEPVDRVPATSPWAIGFVILVVIILFLLVLQGLGSRSSDDSQTTPKNNSNEINVGTDSAR